ncbi:hypothetical protein [Spirosoma pollinicola]|uniref:DUF4386 domain-containing protein n=1 Tax=Spirosoma pollinicola TaxID=2057025 RepID=A0A2K8YWJ8_9BACT|nr:hypothetical protein [Spirosoma pollinicola]AUD01964.1 hypothetical protein CWM47_09120 [Spirosoma pollinicola]
MNKTFFLLIVITGASLAFFAYCAILINWVQDYSSGVYVRNHTEAILESGALVAYTYFGIKFFHRHVSSLR